MDSPFAEYLQARRAEVEAALAAAHRVVVHRRQVVVDEGIRVNQLDRARRRQGQ